MTRRSARVAMQFLPHRPGGRLIRLRMLFGLLSLTIAGVAGVRAAPAVSFSLDVQPIIQGRCVQCHRPGGAGYEVSGLDLRSYDGLMKGTRHGKVVVPGDPLSSNIMVLIEGRADRSIRMPHRQRPLLKQQIEIIRDWVIQGAKDN